MPRIASLLPPAVARRHHLLERLHREGTDTYRLLHGIAEGAPGVTVDRYGGVWLVQTFRGPLPAGEVEALQQAANQALGLDLPVVCNHRGRPDPDAPAPHQPTAEALAERVCHEAGVRLPFQARHRGQDPWLFLDLRAGRAVLRAAAAGQRVLNLFAYTCSAGVMAAAAGATQVVNVDFATSALAVGARARDQNGIAAARCTLFESDCLPVLRQLAGQPVQRRGKHVPYPRIEPQPFDRIVLDPPRFAKSPFGTVDVVRDYPSLWKPALLALAPGGAILATNHVPEVSAADWHELLRRSAAKAGRPLRDLQPIALDADFPSFDGQPPLKMVWATV
ncbi:MAG: class I SAM-dependent methyltransferase [Planctomycetes bacterium]|nr:class I SAM-dependent methyltransferase [Planctomycetota bacterium]